MPRSNRRPLEILSRPRSHQESEKLPSIRQIIPDFQTEHNTNSYSPTSGSYQESDSEITEAAPEHETVDRHSPMRSFTPPKWTRTLQELGLSDDNATTSFAISSDFLLFPKATVEDIRRELLNNKASKTDQLTPKHGGITDYSWAHPETTKVISHIVGMDVVPVMDMKVSHHVVNNTGPQEEHAIKWHQDDYPFACILVLSNTTHNVGGETIVKLGSGEHLKIMCYEMGSAYIVQGRCIFRAVRALKGCSKLILATTYFRPRSPFSKDHTLIRSERDVSQLTQFCRYRWKIAIQRLKAVLQILGGKQVSRGDLDSLVSFGANLKDVHEFLQVTRQQLKMKGNNEPFWTDSSYLSVHLDSIAKEPTWKSAYYSFGVAQVIRHLESGLHQLQSIDLDADLVVTIFQNVDAILRAKSTYE